jgi:1,4-alpha-glucan branching enzyme
MEAFEAELNHAAGKYGWLSHPSHEILVHEGDKVIAFARGCCVFVFNFHTTREHMRYEVNVPPQHAAGSLVCVLDTSDHRFAGPTGGGTALAKGGQLQMNLPPQTALVLAPQTFTSPLLGA